MLIKYRVMTNNHNQLVRHRRGLLRDATFTTRDWWMPSFLMGKLRAAVQNIYCHARYLHKRKMCVGPLLCNNWRGETEGESDEDRGEADGEKGFGRKEESTGCGENNLKGQCQR